ncbi:hypothetical protein EDB19DRAFT_1897409 [Suillus lakei]|nr:hypothetical protein EDB19DRAFT_1897409 [Suillus lakei]
MSASAPTTDSKSLGHVREVFHEYITNEMPINLLHITKHDQKISFKLVDRDFIREHFKSVPTREDRIKERMVAGQAEPLYHHVPKEVPDDHSASKKVPDVAHRPYEPGWKKLEDFCCTAKDVHDCEFAWSDTCCINKTSSSELDESIRSMFRWYRNSHVCIAFLWETADLAALRMQEKGGIDKKAIDAWFVRGWTLQELLAPSQIKFYGTNWEPLIQDSMNDRDDELTDISMDDLRSFTPGTDRVPEKLFWASKRRTTRTEDIAYCLIGIFNISLMIAYGEGNRAFFRLMEEILKRYDK